MLFNFYLKRKTMSIFLQVIVIIKWFLSHFLNTYKVFKNLQLFVIKKNMDFFVMIQRVFITRIFFPSNYKNKFRLWN